jgi:hypothetical protein
MPAIDDRREVRPQGLEIGFHGVVVSPIEPAAFTQKSEKV